jgi:hypothetical protein
MTLLPIRLTELVVEAVQDGKEAVDTPAVHL